MKIRVRHLRAAGVCPRAKLWFADHGLDWKAFIKDGIDEELLLNTKDAQAIHVVEVANGKG